ncbi:MAG: ABC transporter substrate-binding protein, partial [Deltaproteobacteria bacterium]|nr:ABC transporter substrate-binding protein [Deltaproteobacteria bacterium]
YLPTYVSFFSPAYGAIQPKSYIEKNGVAYFAQHPVGAGPWKMVKHVPGDSLQFEAVKNHWRQTPAFAAAKLMLVPEDPTRIAMLQTGEADVIDSSLDGGRALAGKGFNVQAMSSMQATVMLTGAFGKESAKLPTYDVRVRQALSYAINRQEIQKGFLYGTGTPALPGLLVAEAADDVDIPYWQAQADKLYAKYDPAAAKKLLAEAGYSNGFNIKIWQNTMGSGEYLPKIAELVAAYWGAIGVKTELVPSDWGAVRPIANILREPTSPARGQAVMMRLIPRPTMKTMFVSMINTKGTVALLQDSFPEEDQIENAIGTELDPAKRRQLVTQIVQRLADAWVALPIGGVPVTAAMGPRIDFVFPPATSHIMTYSDMMRHSNVK